MDKKLFTILVSKLCKTLDMAQELSSRFPAIDFDPLELPIVEGILDYFEVTLSFEHYYELLCYLTSSRGAAATPEELYNLYYGDEKQMNYREFKIVITGMKKIYQLEKKINKFLDSEGLSLESEVIDLVSSPGFEALDLLIRMNYPDNIITDMIYDHIENDSNETVKQLYDRIEKVEKAKDARN